MGLQYRILASRLQCLLRVCPAPRYAVVATRPIESEAADRRPRGEPTDRVPVRRRTRGAERTKSARAAASGVGSGEPIDAARTPGVPPATPRSGASLPRLRCAPAPRGAGSKAGRAVGSSATIRSVPSNARRAADRDRGARGPGARGRSTPSSAGTHGTPAAARAAPSVREVAMTTFAIVCDPRRSASAKRVCAERIDDEHACTVSIRDPHRRIDRTLAVR